MNNDLISTIAPFISRSSPAIKNFIASGEFEDVVEEISENFNLNENEISNLSDIILLILVGAVNPEDLLEKVIEVTMLPKNMAEDLATEIQSIILSTFAVETTSNMGVGQSFEEIILNQARAMQPAKPADSRIMNYESGSMNGEVEPPDNLPIKQGEQGVIHNYIGGNDPYREPTN